jgi:hypothetical protein
VILHHCILGPDQDDASIRHGILGIAQQIADNLEELVVVRAYQMKLPMVRLEQVGVLVGV